MPNSPRLRADPEKSAASALLELERVGDFLRLSTDPEETRSWRNKDLASFVENRLGERVDPDQASDEQRAQWIERVTCGEGIADPHAGYSVPFWIVEQQERIGTFAVARSTVGQRLLQVSSLYVVPRARGCGHAWAALRATDEAARGAGLAGIRLSTDWSWQGAVRFYLRCGMWVSGWKRSLDFVWHEDYPAWQLELEGDRACFVVNHKSTNEPLIEARRNGDRLDWKQHASVDDNEIFFRAPGTFATALAVHGFPLITSDDAWREQLAQGFSDFGGPEGLAFKIRRFEAWSRKQGWHVDTPRIPGIDYPDWDSID